MACLEEVMWPFHVFSRSLALFIHSIIAVASQRYLWKVSQKVTHSFSPSSTLWVLLPSSIYILIISKLWTTFKTFVQFYLFQSFIRWCAEFRPFSIFLCRATKRCFSFRVATPTLHTRPSIERPDTPIFRSLLAWSKIRPISAPFTSRVACNV